MPEAKRPNTRCLKCGHDFYVPGHPAEPGYKEYVDCPACGEHYGEEVVEGWAQIMWPSPEDVEAGYFDPD